MSFCEGVDSGDVCRFPRDYFPFLAEDDKPTTQHHECWVGMSQSDDFGQNVGFPHLGKACEIGCVSCGDLPAELTGSRAPITGIRWLHPHPTEQSIDATGRKSPLRADRINLIPRFATHYLMGHCYDNEGTECFHDSVCGCFRERSGASNIGLEGQGPTPDRCIPTEGNKWYARGFFPSEFTYQGMDFPPRVSGDGVSGGMWCRKFVTQNQDGTPGDEDLWIVIGGGPMYSPAYIRNMYRGIFQGTTCVVNAMVLVVSAVPESTCQNAYRNVAEVGGGARPDVYNASASRQSFRLIRISGDPHFRSIDNLFDGLRPRDFAHLKAKNEVIKTVLADAFPTTGGSISFDQVTHDYGGGLRDVGGPELNTWSRTWDALEEGVDAASLPKVSGFPMVGRWVGLLLNDVPADLVISKVESRLWLMPINVMNTDFSLSAGSPAIEFHARYRLRVELAIRVAALAHDVNFEQPWFPEDHPERSQVINIQYNGIEPPAVEPPGLNLKFVMFERIEPEPGDDPDTVRGNDVPVEVPKVVEWLGYLGQVSVPRARSSRYFYMNEGRSLVGGVLEGAHGLEIPGWPFAHGSQITDTGKLDFGDTAQIHGGRLKIAFVAN